MKIQLEFNSSWTNSSYSATTEAAAATKANCFAQRKHDTASEGRIRRRRLNFPSRLQLPLKRPQTQLEPHNSTACRRRTSVCSVKGREYQSLQEIGAKQCKMLHVILFLQCFSCIFASCRIVLSFNRGHCKFVRLNNENCFKSNTSLCQWYYVMPPALCPSIVCVCSQYKHFY